MHDFTLSPPILFHKERDMFKQLSTPFKALTVYLITIAQQISGGLHLITTPHVIGIFMILNGLHTLLEQPPTGHMLRIVEGSPQWVEPVQVLLFLMVLCGFFIMVNPRSRFFGYFTLPLLMYGLTFMFVNLSVRGFLFYGFIYLMPLLYMAKDYGPRTD
jgi:hypothetical protein